MTIELLQKGYELHQAITALKQTAAGVEKLAGITVPVRERLKSDLQRYIADLELELLNL